MGKGKRGRNKKAPPEHGGLLDRCKQNGLQVTEEAVMVENILITLGNQGGKT